MYKLSFLVFVFLSIGFSQSDYVETFYVSELALRPAEIILSPNHITVLEFENSVDEWASGQGALFTVEQSGSKLYFTTGQRGGSTDLVIDVGGRTALFKINIDSENPSTHRYIIRNDRPSGGYATPLTSALLERNINRSNEPIVNAQPLAQSDYPTSTPINTAVIDTNIQAGHLTLQNSGFNSQGHYTVFFTYVNNSPYNISLIARHIAITQNGRPLEIVNVNKEPLKNLVSPQESQRGYILVSGANVGQINVNWRVMALTPNGSVATILSGDVQAQ